MTDSDRFDREIAARLRAHEERAPGGVAPELTDRATRGAWAPLALVGAAGLVVGVVLVGVLLQRPGPPSGEGTPSPSASVNPSASATPEGTPTPTPTAAPSASAVPSPSSSGVWSAATIEVPGDDGRGPYFSGVRWYAGIGYVAYGQDRAATSGAIGPPAFWLSADGLGWTRSSTPPGLDGFAVMDLEGGAPPAGPRLVAVTTDHKSSRLLVSDDGRAWSIADGPATAAVMNAVAYGNGGFLAVGTDRDWTGTEHITGVVWRSVDGASWLATTPAALDGVVPVSVEAIVGHGYVALGRIDGEAPPRTLAWTSMDGVAWQSNVIRPAQNEGGSIDLVSDSDGSVVVVAGNDPNAYAGLSADGAAWSFEWLPEGYTSSTAIDISPRAVVVVASQYIADGPTNSFVWVRNLPVGTWRTIDWRSHVDPGEDYGAAIGVAIGQSRTLILFSSGRILLSDGLLP